VLRVPGTWEPVTGMFLGYPAESWEAAGQEPRPPFEGMFFEQRATQLFARDPEVTKRLQDGG